MNKVTDSNKIVTDKQVLNHLAKQGIDKDYVEFVQDYAPRSRGKEHSPYAKFYRDLKSGKKFMVVSNLPKVRPDGVRIKVGWIKQGDTYVTEPNLFSATVEGSKVTITCEVDQPDGRKIGDYTEWEPQLFLDGVLVSPISNTPILLNVDPTNENLSKNVLEWNYGFCKRRIRVIEGRIREKWVTSTKGIIEIEHNPKGNMALRYGHASRADSMGDITVQVVGSKEILDTSGLPDSAFPVEIGASPETFYPDANPETSSVDGWCRQKYSIGSGVSWATIIGAAGNFGDATPGPSTVIGIQSDTGSDDWIENRRGIYLFDTAGLPNGAVISLAVLSLYGASKTQTSSFSPDINIYASNPNTNTDVIASDYATVLSTPFCDTPITYAGWDVAGYNDFTLNAAGRAAIDKAGVSKFGGKNASYDAASSSPAWENNKASFMDVYNSEQGAGFKPKLVVTYTTGWSGGNPLGVVVATVAKINGVALADIAELNGVA